MKGLMSDIFSTIRFKTVIYFKHGFCQAWGMNIPKGKYAQFHIVTEGNCLLYLDGQSDPIQLYRGDIVILPKGRAHQLKDDARAVCLDGSAIVSKISAGLAPFEGPKISTQLICGHFEMDEELSHPVLEQLPSCIIVPGNEYNRFDLIQAMLELIMEELDEQKIGYQIVSKRLAEVLFISIIRHYYLHQSQEKINLFKDDLISRAVEIMHNDLSINWPIDQLARQVGVSRTLFITRFKDVLGDTPFRYISSWRMTKAKYLLQHTDALLTEIADRLGYQSETAFNRAFKKHAAISPGKFRKKYQSTVEN